MLMFKDRGGFTFFEVMIVLGITSLLLVATIVMFSGQQRRSQFQQSMRFIEAEMLDVFNDVTTGYFPESLNNCSGDATNGPSFSGTRTEQGTNLSCIYVGKAIYFQEDTYTTYPLVGYRFNIYGRPVSTFHQSLPKVIPNEQTAINYRWGVQLSRVPGSSNFQIYTGNTSSATADQGAALVIVSTTTKEAELAGSATYGLYGPSNEFNSGQQRIALYNSGNPDTTDVSPVGGTTAFFDAQIRNMKSWPSSNKLTICFEDADYGAPGRLTGGIVMFSGNDSTSIRLQNDTDVPRCQ